jgi:CheY-like chemotaxis protein
MGDPTRLRQVLANLIGNAVKFTERGSIRVEVSRHGDAVKFAVADTGVGIPRDKLGAIFQAFEQAGHGAAGEQLGTGLGLAISREIVTLMGGQLNVESTPGRGSRFWFQVDLPVEAAPVPVDGAPVDGARIEREAAPPPLESTPVRVLLVEDATVNQRVVLGMLRLLGHQADLAKNGAEAVDAIERHFYDLVLMDIQMPVLDGLEATVRIRAREAHQGIRRTTIHGLSANAYAADRERALAAGMDGYLTKPVALDQLRAVISALQRTALPKEKTPASALAPAGGSSSGNELTAPGTRS